MPVLIDPVVTISRYFFPVQEVRANPDHKVDEEHHTMISIACNFPVHPDEADGVYAVSMVIKIDEERSNNEPYRFTVEAFGAFKVDAQRLGEKLDAQEEARTVGTEVLIGVIRERVSLLASGGPWGGLMINTISLASAKDGSED